MSICRKKSPCYTLHAKNVHYDEYIELGKGLYCSALVSRFYIQHYNTMLAKLEFEQEAHAKMHIFGHMQMQLIAIDEIGFGSF